MRVFFAARAGLWDAWAPALRAACPEMELKRDGDPAGFDALIYAPGFPEDGSELDFAPFTRARVVQSLWAGVERIVTNPTLTQPLCRMVDPGLARGMTEYCTGWAMRAHLGMDAYAQDCTWLHEIVPPLAADRIELAGNTAAAGAAALLISRQAQAMAERLRRSAKLVNLAHYPDFDDAFIDHLYLRPMQAD